MISCIWFDHAWFSRYFIFSFFYSCGLLSPPHPIKNSKNLIFSESSIIFKEKIGLDQLTQLSHQYSWRYGPSKFELKFSLTRQIPQKSTKIYLGCFQIWCHLTAMDVNQMMVACAWFNSSWPLRYVIHQVILYPLSLLRFASCQRKNFTHPSKTLSSSPR